MNKLKEIKVSGPNWNTIIKIDPANFDDIYIEACTQAVEQMAKKRQLNLSTAMFCMDLDTNIITTCNSYKILINAGFHATAEHLRKILYKETNIDFSIEPIISKL